MSKIGVAVIGLGYWGPNLLRNYVKIPNVVVKYGCDLLGKNILKARQQFPHISYTSNFNEILKDTTVHAVSIATPLTSHYLLAKKALLANKHVLLEKPFTTSVGEAKDLIQIAKKNKKILMAGHTFVYSDSIKKIKKIIDKKNLGKLFYYDSTRINLGKIQSDTNVVWDLAPHDFSILNFLIPEKPVSIRAMGSSFIGKKQDEQAHIFIQYKNNFTAHIHVSWLSPVKMRAISIVGSKKMIVYDDVEPSEKIRLYDKNITISKQQITPFSPLYRSGDIVIPHIKQQEALFNELSHFIFCIKRSATPLTSGTDGLKVIAMLEATDLAIKKGSEIQLKLG